MMNRKIRCKLPENVDEAAELLISDLLTQHLQTLSNMTDEDFEHLCDSVSPYLTEEFKLWQGNDTLLDSCYANVDGQETDPARIILKRVKQILHDFNGCFIIT